MVTPVSSPGGAPGGTEALRKQRLWGARQEAGRPQRRWGRVLARPCAAHGDAPRGDPRLLADRSEVLCGESAREGGQTSREAGPGCSGPWVLSTRARLSAGGHALVAPRLGPELIKPPRALEPDRWPPPEPARGGAVGSHRWFLSPSPSVTHRQCRVLSPAGTLGLPWQITTTGWLGATDYPPGARRPQSGIGVPRQGCAPREAPGGPTGAPPRPAPVRVSRWPQLSEGETRAFHTYTHPRFLENSLI